MFVLKVEVSAWVS